MRKSDRSYGDVDQVAFPSVAQDRYETLDALNAAGGPYSGAIHTRHGHRFGTFARVPRAQPSLLVDFDRLLLGRVSRLQQIAMSLRSDHSSMDDLRSSAQPRL